VYKVNAVINKPAAGIRYADMETEKFTSLQLSARNIGTIYTWYPSAGLNNSGIREPLFNYDRDVNYTINIQDINGCITTDSLLVKIKVIDTSVLKADIVVPKAWTPNTDGHNDILRPKLVNMKTLIYFRVFNRWGQLVYSTSNPNEGWDGIFKGLPQTSDMYSWSAEGIGLNGRRITRYGNAVLLR
jgi:gliding motility-associated-like protein